MFVGNSGDVSTSISITPVLDDLTMKNGWIPAGLKVDIDVKNEGRKIRFIGLPHICHPSVLPSKEIKVFRQHNMSDNVVEENATELLMYHVLFEPSSFSYFQNGANCQANVHIPNVTIMVFRHENLTMDVQIVIVPNTEFYYNTTKEWRLNDGFHLEQEFDYYCESDGQNCGFGRNKFMLEYDDAHVIAIPNKNITIRKPNDLRSRTRITVTQTSDFDGIVNFNLKESLTHVAYPFIVKSMNSATTPPLSNFQVHSLYLLFGIALLGLTYVEYLQDPQSPYTYTVRLTALWLTIIWFFSLLWHSYNNKWHFNIAIRQNDTAFWITIGMSICWLFTSILKFKDNQNVVQAAHVSSCIISLIFYMAGIINSDKVVTFLGAALMVSGYVYNMESSIKKNGFFVAGVVTLLTSLGIKDVGLKLILDKMEKFLQ